MKKREPEIERWRGCASFGRLLTLWFLLLQSWKIGGFREYLRDRVTTTRGGGARCAVRSWRTYAITITSISRENTLVPSVLRFTRAATLCSRTRVRNTRKRNSVYTRRVSCGSSARILRGSIRKRELYTCPYYLRPKFSTRRDGNRVRPYFDDYPRGNLDDRRNFPREVVCLSTFLSVWERSWFFSIIGNLCFTWGNVCWFEKSPVSLGKLEEVFPGSLEKGG